MDRLKKLVKFVKKNPTAAVATAGGLGSADFLTNLMIALSDGKLDSNEIHQLMSCASGIQLVFLCLVLIEFQRKKK